MKKILFGSAMLTLAFVGCQNDEFLQNEAMQDANYITIEANQGASTRTALTPKDDPSEGYKTVWSEGDQIYLSSADGNTKATLTLISGAGETTATFGGTISGNGGIEALEYSIFPVPNNEGKIDLTQREANKPNAPMIAGFNPDAPSSITFAGTCGMVAIEISGNEGGSVTLDNETYDLGGTAVPYKEGDTWKLKYTRGTTGIKVTDLAASDKVFVPIVTTAVDASDNDSNLPETAVEIEVTIQDENEQQVATTTISTKVSDSQVSQTDVPEIEVNEGGNGISSTVNTEAALRAAVAAGGDVVLGGDITLNTPLEISKNITLDLGGHTLTASACTAFNVKAGTFTIKNGTVKAETSECDVISITGNAEAVIVVNVEANTTLTAGDCAIVVPGANESTDITINTAGTLITESKYENEDYVGYAAIQANGNSEGVKLNVTGGSITAKMAAIYFPCTTNLNISGGTITGATAVYQKSGILNISGGKLVGNGIKAEYEFNNSGCKETGDALVIEACGYPGGNPQVTITGGEFVSEYANAIGSYVGNSVLEENKITGFVKGGIFHDASVFEYLADGAVITVANAEMEISKAITIPVEKTATINLKKSSITAPNTDAFEVAGTLTINADDVSEIYAGSSGEAGSVCAVWANGGNVTINGGYYKVHHDKDGKRNDCIYAGYNADNEDTPGKITINGGKFEFVWPATKNYTNEYNGDWFLLNCADKDPYTTKITVNGGSFKNHVPQYENVTPAGRKDKEVVLGEGKKVYYGDNEVEVAHDHTSETVIWYTVE